MRFSAFALTFLFLSGLVACDSEITSGQVEEAVATVYEVNGCVDPDSEKAFEGELTLSRDAFALEVLYLRDGEADLVVAKDSGVVESYDPLRLLTSTEGDTLFATVGPDPQDPTTVVLGELPWCPVFSFTVEGSVPDLTLVGGERRDAVYDIDKVRFRGETTFYDLPLEICSRYECKNLVGGSVRMEDGGVLYSEFIIGGFYDSPFDPYDYRVIADTARSVGTYIISGPLVALNPGTGRVEFGFERDGTVDMNGGFVPPYPGLPFGQFDLRFQRQ